MIPAGLIEHQHGKSSTVPSVFLWTLALPRVAQHGMACPFLWELNGSQPFLLGTTFTAVGSSHENSLDISPLAVLIKSKYYITTCFSDWRTHSPNSAQGGCKTEYQIYLSGVSSLFQDSEEPSTLITVPLPHKYGRKEGQRRAVGPQGKKSLKFHPCGS